QAGGDRHDLAARRGPDRAGRDGRGEQVGADQHGLAGHCEQLLARRDEERREVRALQNRRGGEDGGHQDTATEEPSSFRLTAPLVSVIGLPLVLMVTAPPASTVIVVPLWCSTVIVLSAGGSGRVPTSGSASVPTRMCSPAAWITRRPAASVRSLAPGPAGRPSSPSPVGRASQRSEERRVGKE